MIMGMTAEVLLNNQHAKFWPCCLLLQKKLFMPGNLLNLLYYLIWLIAWGDIIECSLTICCIQSSLNLFVLLLYIANVCFDNQNFYFLLSNKVS